MDTLTNAYYRGVYGLQRERGISDLRVHEEGNLHCTNLHQQKQPSDEAVDPSISLIRDKFPQMKMDED